jgi:hypothetical protein
MVLSLTVSTRLIHNLPGYGLQARELLKHSIWTAVAAQELAILLGHGAGGNGFYGWAFT